jgi:type IV secretion system protein VirB1
MPFHGIVLAAALQQCAPNVGARTMAAIVQVESGGNPYAMHDNTSGRSYFPAEKSDAVALANALLAQGHSVDLGISQINSNNLPGIGLSVDNAFDACRNLQAGARILSHDYRTAAAQFGGGQYALRRAIGAYNTGSIYRGDGYIERILAAAGFPQSMHVVEDTTPALTVVATVRPPVKTVNPNFAAIMVPVRMVNFATFPGR